MANSEIDVLNRFVAAYRRQLIFGRIVWVALVAGTTYGAFLALLEAAFALFPWTVLPLAADIGAAGLGLFLLGYCSLTATLFAPSRLAVARTIERSSGWKNSLLSIAIELAADARTSGNQFTGAACERAAGDLAHFPRRPRPRPFFPHLAGAAIVLAAWCALNPFLTPRLLDFWNLPFSPLARPDVVISPGSLVVPANASVSLKLRPRAARYPSSRLTLTSFDGERLSSMLLRPDSTGGFVYRRDSVKTSFVYRFSLGASQLGADTVTVAPPPRLYRLSVTLLPPAYTHRAPQVLPEGQGNFDAYAGSRARIRVESNFLSKAWLVRGRDSLALSTAGASASGEFTVLSPCNYTFALVDSLGQKSDSLPQFHIGCIPDEPPSVQIVKPGFNKELQPEQLETLSVEGVDDIGIRSMVLKWQKRQERKASPGERDLSLPSMPTVIRTSLVWRLTELSLYPGDTVLYWAEITDTRPSPQTKSSDTFWLRVPGFEEIHNRLALKEEAAEKTIGGVRGRHSELEERLRSAAKSAAGQKELSWEQKQVLHDAKNELEAQADSLRTALRSLQENIERMKQEGAVGEEIAKKMDAVRQAMEALVRQYGDSLLAALRAAEKPATSMLEMRQAVEKAMAMLPKLDEQLDNVLKFLAALKRDRKLADLAMRAEQLSKDQASLARGEKESPALAAPQKDVLERIGELSKDLTGQANADSGAAAGLDSLQSKERLDSLRKTMQSAMQRRTLPARETMNQMSGTLLSLSQDLLQMMSSAMGSRLERERAKLLSLSRDALTLADWQEEIERESPESADQASTARSQQALKDALKKSAAAAESLSMIAPADMHALRSALKDALDASDNVLGSLSTSDGRGAMPRSSSSLRALGNGALAALSKMDNGQQQGAAGGACMMPGLRRAAGRQAAINAATAELLRSLFGESQGSSPQGSGKGTAREEARRAAQEAQQGIADELKKLSEQYGKEAGEGLGNKVGELEEEARRLAAMLEHPSPEVAEHQDRFLARMLETTLSMHRQGEGKDEWKSRSADHPFEDGAAIEPGDFFKDTDAFHRLRQRAFQGNFPEEYRRALRDYFDALGEKYLK